MAPNSPKLCREDWTLLDESGEPVARIYDTEQADILGSWRWEIEPFFKSSNQGTVKTGTDARLMCEKRLADRIGAA